MYIEANIKLPTHFKEPCLCIHCMYVSEAVAPPWVESWYYNEVKVMVGHSRGSSMVQLRSWVSGV